MAPAWMRPSSSGSTTCMARSAGARPRWLLAHASRRVVATIACSTGTPARSNRVSSPGSAPAGEGGGGDDQRRRQVGRAPSRQRRATRRSLRLATKIGAAAMPLAGERGAKRIDRRYIRRKQHGAVEQERHDRRVCRPRIAEISAEIDDAPTWQIEAGLRHGSRFGRRHLVPRQASPACRQGRACWPDRPRGNRRAGRRVRRAAASRPRSAVRRSSRHSPGNSASSMPRSRASAASRSQP